MEIYVRLSARWQVVLAHELWTTELANAYVQMVVNRLDTWVVGLKDGVPSLNYLARSIATSSIEGYPNATRVFGPVAAGWRIAV